MKIRYVIPALIIAVAVIISCKKEQPAIPMVADDPCDCATEVSAEFTMGEISGIGFGADTTFTDTIFHTKNLHFVAQEEDAQYTWYIGTEVLNTKEVTRYFGPTLAGTDHTISLVVRKTPNTNCFPQDDGYDSIYMPLHVSVYPIDVGDSIYLGTIEGTYRVKMPHLPDSADVTYNCSKGQVGIEMFNIYNYDGLGSNCLNQSEYSGGNYRMSTTRNGTSVSQCDYIRGYIHNRLDGIIEMNFSFGSNNPASSTYYERTYLGRKIY